MSNQNQDNVLSISWHGLNKNIAKEINDFICWGWNGGLPDWMLSQKNGGPGPEPAPKDYADRKYYEAAYDKWDDNARNFLESKYHGIDNEVFQESGRDAETSFYGSPENNSERLVKITKALMKGASDILDHYNSNATITGKLQDYDSNTVHTYTINRAAVSETEESAAETISAPRM